jgi:hypothetical protein
MKPLLISLAVLLIAGLAYYLYLSPKTEIPGHYWRGGIVCATLYSSETRKEAASICSGFGRANVDDPDHNGQMDFDSEEKAEAWLKERYIEEPRR